MNIQKIYKYSVILVFVVVTLFRVQIGYSNKINILNEQANNFIIQNSLLLQSMNYVQDVRLKLRDEPIYLWPIHADDYDRITSEFGYRQLLNPFTGGTKDSEHTGIDIVGSHHARVIAIADGEVVEYWPVPNNYFEGDPVFGGKVVIKHNDGRYSMYAHMDVIYNISEHGSKRFIKAGQVIGRTGNTGLSYGEHLHFELWDENKVPIQSLFYLKDPHKNY